MLPASIIPVTDVAVMDAAAVQLGCKIADLMEQAGQALADEVYRFVDTLPKSGSVLFVCGSGNNGGDGYVSARFLAELLQGTTVFVQVWAACSPKSPLCCAAAAALPPSVTQVETLPQEKPLCIVDCIIGAGVVGPPRPAIIRVLEQLAAYGAGEHIPIVAADVPTALGFDVQLTTAQTVCFQLAKQPVVAAALPHSIADIGVPQSAWADIHASCLRQWPKHKAQGHKGQHGSLLIIGGQRFAGAARLACAAAMVSACDVVHAWAPASVHFPAHVVHHHDSTGHHTLIKLIQAVDAVLIGPGLGRAESEICGIVQRWIGNTPLIIDADALYEMSAFCASPHEESQLLLTPHAAELRMLIGEHCVVDVHNYASLQRVLVAKGAVDFISDGQRWQQNYRGNPRMAMGGTGDCLSGFIAGLVARGCGVYEAGRMALFVLCEAADELWQECGPLYTPEQLIERMPQVIQQHLCVFGLWPPLEKESQ